MASFKIGFVGPSVDNGEIEVADLAPSLLALGELFSAANSALNNERAEAKLKIRASEKGSFVALLSLDVSFLTDLLDSLSASPDRVTAAKDLIEILLGVGALAGGTAIGFFGALRHLKGKKADSSHKGDDGTVSITVDGTTIVVDSKTAILLEDRNTREATKKFVETSLTPSGISSVDLLVPDTKEKTPGTGISLTKEDFHSVSIPESSDEDVEAITQSREALLKIVSAQFHEGYLWRFSDGVNTFTASMNDPLFLNRIDLAEIQLSKNDTLRCVIEETQELLGIHLKSSAKIVEVKEYISGARQLRLF